MRKTTALLLTLLVLTTLFIAALAIPTPAKAAADRPPYTVSGLRFEQGFDKWGARAVVVSGYIRTTNPGRQARVTALYQDGAGCSDNGALGSNLAKAGKRGLLRFNLPVPYSCVAPWLRAKLIVQTPAGSHQRATDTQLRFARTKAWIAIRKPPEHPDPMIVSGVGATHRVKAWAITPETTDQSVLIPHFPDQAATALSNQCLCGDFFQLNRLFETNSPFLAAQATQYDSGRAVNGDTRLQISGPLSNDPLRRRISWERDLMPGEQVSEKIALYYTTTTLGTVLGPPQEAHKVFLLTCSASMPTGLYHPVRSVCLPVAP